MIDNEIEKSKRWTAFLKRLQGEVNGVADDMLRNNKRNGVCVVNLHLVVDSNGTPLVWAVNKSVRIEPSNNAREILLALLGDAES
jgi:hypothetical protein